MRKTLRQCAKLLTRVPTVVALVFASAAVLFWWTILRMPGASFRGPVANFSAEELRLSGVLERDVRFLAVDIGERNLEHPHALDEAAAWIERQLQDAALATRRHSYAVAGHAVHNLEVVLPAASADADVVVVGAHYDSAPGTAGANDNATGVACLLELARRFARHRALRELRLVWFSNEEPPHFQTDDMGSLHYARNLASEPRTVVAMLSLETLGYYSDLPGSQQYPAAVSGFFPDAGNFVAFVGNNDSAELVRQAVGTFRNTTSFPSEGVSLSGRVQGIGWSDHWSFWQTGVPAIMLTDTAPFRYEHYHRASDTPDRLDYRRLARVTLGIESVVHALLDHQDSPPPHDAWPGSALD
jgi:hypothetical protein